MPHPAKMVWHVTAALAQAAGSWGLLQYFIPLAIVRWQQGQELHHLGLEGQHLPGLVLFALASAANLWSRLTLAVLGRGSLAVINPPERLVVTGPYAWMRNPIAATTIAQGVGVMVYTGSALVIPYLAVLALTWQLLIRPASEHALQRRFGREYEFYRRSVRIWLPMRRGFRPRGALPPIETSEVVVRRGGRQRRRRR